MLAIVCPGQGSQTPGLLHPWLEVPGIADQLAGLSEAAQVDLVVHGTLSDAETIRDTAVAQPLIVAAGLASLAALFPQTSPGTVDAAAVGVVAGHSVGELTAAAATGVVSPHDAMRLVSARGRAMAAAAALTPTGMSAVLGGDPQEVADVLERHGLTPANMNGGGQVVAAGTMAQLAALSADPPARCRVIPLQVAGAFHTAHMAPAVEALRATAATLAPAAPRTALLSNADGAVVTDGQDVLARLVEQVRSPVRWDLCSERLAALGVTGLLELTPAGTLAGLAKRGLKGVEIVALKTPQDLDAAAALVAAHGSRGGAA